MVVALWNTNGPKLTPTAASIGIYMMQEQLKIGAFVDNSKSFMRWSTSGIVSAGGRRVQNIRKSVTGIREPTGLHHHITMLRPLQPTHDFLCELRDRVRVANMFR
jgi:hypothetical protein